MTKGETSHCHYDMQAFQTYPDKQLPFAVKRGIADKARKVGFKNITELDAWETTILGPIKITAASGKHAILSLSHQLTNSPSMTYTIYTPTRGVWVS